MPLTSVTADSVPCNAGDATVIVAPGIDRPSFDVMVPVMTPVCRPWAFTPCARPATRAIAPARLASTVFIADPPHKTVHSPRHKRGGTRWDDWTDRLAGCQAVTDRARLMWRTWRPT